jgi:hypothetical protein
MLWKDGGIYLRQHEIELAEARADAKDGDRPHSAHLDAARTAQDHAEPAAGRALIANHLSRGHAPVLDRLRERHHFLRAQRLLAEDVDLRQRALNHAHRLPTSGARLLAQRRGEGAGVQH